MTEPFDRRFSVLRAFRRKRPEHGARLRIDPILFGCGLALVAMVIGASWWCIERRNGRIRAFAEPDRIEVYYDYDVGPSDWLRRFLDEARLEPTPQDIVERMLEVAKVDKDDTVVDLGSGDGRIVIRAAREHGCRAIGYEIDKELVEISRDRVQREGLGELVTIRQQDMYTAELSEANVVAVFQYTSVLARLKPQFEQLEPGSRIVSHFFEIPGIRPSQVVEVESQETGSKHKILLYETPLQEVEADDGNAE